MSWFSNRFATSLKVPESGDGDRDNAHDAQGKGVKEDLSELTKTFTRQLWGVASFLAPPPSDTPAVEDGDPSSSLPNHRIQPRPEINSFSPSGEISFSHELVDVDFHASVDPVASSQEETSNRAAISRGSGINVDEKGSHLAPDHGLTGVGKDLAELRGSVATGLSKLLKVVREEIDRNEHTEARHDYGYDEEEEEQEGENDTEDYDGETKGYVAGRNIPVLNSLFKPFLSGVLQNDRDTRLHDSATDDDEDEDDDPFDNRGHKKSRPLGVLSFGRSLGESLGGVSKLASTLFPANLDSDDEQSAVEPNPNFEAVGVTEEVLTFVKNVSMHPETWLDFPLFTDNDEDDDFDMSDAQKEHVHEVERASPRLAALRIELCPDYMSEGRFWKIYFVLLHSRLNKKDAVLLSTPQIMEARLLLLSNLQKKESQGSIRKSDQQQDFIKGETLESGQSFKIVSLQSAMEVPAKDFDQAENIHVSKGRHQSSSTNVGDMSEEVQNKNVLANTVKLAPLNYEEDEADVDNWLHEESSPQLSMSVSPGLANDDDVSFSDLEEDDDSSVLKRVGTTALKGSRGWVELNNNQKETASKLAKGRLHCHQDNERASKVQERSEHNDWLTVEQEVDFA